MMFVQDLLISLSEEPFSTFKLWFLLIFLNFLMAMSATCAKPWFSNVFLFVMGAICSIISIPELLSNPEGVI